MLRSAASPGSVGFGRLGSGVSGLLKVPLSAGHLFTQVRCAILSPRDRWAEKERAPKGARPPRRIRWLLDLAFTEFDVLLRDRIVFLLDHFLGHRARILLGGVVK